MAIFLFGIIIVEIKLPNIWGLNLTKSKDIEIKRPIKEQEKIWKNFLSKLVKKSEEIDLQQSPMSSPRSGQVTKVDEGCKTITREIT